MLGVSLCSAAVGAELIGLEQWVAETEATAAAIEEVAYALARGESRSAAHERLGEIGRRLGQVRHVENGTGRTVAVDNRWAQEVLLRAMESVSAGAEARALRDLASRLRLRAAASEVPKGERYSGDPRALATEVLSAPEFAGRQRGPLDRLTERILSVLARLAEIIFGGPALGARAILYRLGLVALAVVLVVAIVVLVRALVGRSAQAWRPTDIEHKALPPDAGAAFRQALAAMQAGNGRDSLRYFYLTLLLALASSATFEFRPSRTNWEYVRLAAGTPQGEMLSQATGLFEAKYFGGQQCTPEDLLTMRSWAEQALGGGR